jgi:Ca2+-binding RTX toxin-like protein
VEVASGILTIVGSASADHVVVSRRRNRVLVVASFLPQGARSFPAKGIDKIDARLGFGNDLVVIAGNVKLPAILHGEAGDDAIYAGGGASLLLGGLGEDLLIGGHGRNILIGGAAADRLAGGGSGDLQIAGTTAYDDNDTALQSILAEWTSSRSYDKRVANLRSGAGPLLSPTGIRLKKGTTVLDDAAVDTLHGGAGLDWYLFDLAQDQVRDKKKTEAVN